MLRSLHIEHYVLIDSLEIRFPEGFIAITGQTGAGKSILLGALSLLTGGKADAAAILPEGASNCIIEGVFDVRGNAAIEVLCAENDLDWGDGILTLRRVISATGRSRAFLNDEPVALPTLSALAAHLVDIHAQHQTLLLTDPKTQLRMLDYYADDTAQLEAYAAAWEKARGLRSRLKALREEIEKRAQEQDYLQDRLARLQEARLSEGELEALEQEQQLLANAETVKEALFRVEALLGGDAESEGNLPIGPALKEAERLLSKTARFLPALQTLSERTEALRIEADDIRSEVADLNARTEAETGRLEAVEERLSFLYELMRRFSVKTTEELIAERDRLAGLIGGSEAMAEEEVRLSRELAAAEKALDSAAEALTQARKAAAGPFAAEVRRLLGSLELGRAVFEADLEAAPTEGPDGRDRVRFLFSASGAGAPLPLERCASGGELSRIMLCLKALLARYAKMPTLIFDEIDTGVSGSVADRVGALLSEMGRSMQVLAITHLPQVASRAASHYLVEKQHSEGSTPATTIRPLGTAEERTRELARLLSGAEISSAALENAASLLREAGTL